MIPRICFSTLACPQWSVETIIANARAYGYDGIEWRGGDAGHINPSLSQAERARLRQRMDEAELFSLAVTSYTSFVSNDPAECRANVDALRHYLDLAADIGAGYVRAFIGELTQGQTLDAVYPYIIECLQE